MSDFENKNISENAEDEISLVTMLDEDGNEHQFEHVDSFPSHGETYVVLIPTEEEVAAGEPDAVLFFTLTTDEEGNETLSLVEDEAELDMVFEEFKNRMGEVFDFED